MRGKEYIIEPLQFKNAIIVQILSNIDGVGDDYALEFELKLAGVKGIFP